MERKFAEVIYYLTQLLFERGYICKHLFKIWKITRPNCIYDDVSIDDAQYTFFHCERWRLERWDLEACSVENFCNVILSNEENWNGLASYTEALLKSKKFHLDERSRMGVWTPSLNSLYNPDADIDMNEKNAQTDSTSK